MSLKYLLDENVDPSYKTQITRRYPALVICKIGEQETLPRGTLDPEILCWCEEYDFVLVTNNRASMPVHLTDHIAAGRHVPGIIILNQNFSIGQNIEQLIVIAEASFEDEYQDQIIHLPKV